MNVVVLLTLSAYVLNAPLGSMVDTGFEVNVSQNQNLELLYLAPGSTNHVTIGFRTADEAQPYQIWDVNLSNSVSRVVNATLGLPPKSGVLIDETLILGSENPAHLWSYNVETAATNYIAAGPDRDYQSTALGWDGDAYFGTYYLGMVDQYDLDTDTVKAWGKMDPDVDFGEWTLCLSVGGDANYVYSAMRNSAESPNWYYLCITRKSDTNRTVLWKGANLTTSMQIRKGTTSGIWYAQQVTNGVTKYFRIDSGTPVLEGGTPTYNAFPGDVNNEPTTWAGAEDWNVEALYGVEEVAGSTPQAVLRFKPVAESVYTEVLETNNWLVAPGYVGVFEPFSASTFYWATKGYGPCGYFDGSTITIAGNYKHMAEIDFLKVSDTEAYLSGYYQSTARWNPSTAWTRVPLLPNYNTNTYNPYTVFYTGGIYHYFLAQASNGYIYIGIHHERTSTGGELGWYDPSDGSTGSERTTFESFDISDLKSSVGGTKMVYVSSPSTGNVFVWDVATETVSTNFSPIGSVSLDKVVEYESGKMFGVTGARTFAFTTAGELLWTNLLPATAWSGSPFFSYDRRITLGPDNAIWQCAGGDLYRISTTDGSYTNLLETTNDYNTTFLGVDIYLYGGQAGQKIWKVGNALTYIPEAGANPNTARTRRNGVGRFGF